MLKLTMAIAPAMIPTHSGVLRERSDRGKTGLMATLNSTYTKATKKTTNAAAMVREKLSSRNGTGLALRERSWRRAPI